MSITPQTIKDQEFQTKFRGYDTIEVKAYLDLIAEEFFELLEAKNRQDQEVAALQARCQSLVEERDGFEAKLHANDSVLTSDEEMARTREAEMRTLREETVVLAKQIEDLEPKSRLYSLREKAVSAPWLRKCAVCATN